MSASQGPAVSSSGQDAMAIAGYVACALVVVGSFGPWATVFAFSKAGTDGDGVLTLILALVAAVGVFLTARGGRSPQFGAQWWTPIAAAIIVAIGIVDFIDVSNTSIDGFGGDAVSVGWGLWLVVLAGIALLVVSVRLALRARALAARGSGPAH